MKQTLFFITSIVFIISLSFSQTKMNINNLVEHGGKMYKPNEYKPYSGKVFDLYKGNGNKKLEGTYKNGKKKWQMDIVG